MKYLVTVEKTITYTIEVSARDEEKASEKAEELFEKDPDSFELYDENYEVTEIEEAE